MLLHLRAWLHCWEPEGLLPEQQKRRPILLQVTTVLHATAALPGCDVFFFNSLSVACELLAGSATQRAARGTASAGNGKGASLIAPFRERYAALKSIAHSDKETMHQQATAFQQAAWLALVLLAPLHASIPFAASTLATSFLSCRISSATGDAAVGGPGKKVLQPRMSHSQAGSARPAAPPHKMPGMLASTASTSSSSAGSSSKPGSVPQQEQAAAATAAALASSRRHSSASSTRPASQQAAVNVAAAEAAVSAAAAVMKAGSQPRQQQQQQQRKLLPVQTQQQQQRRSRKAPVKGSTKDCCSNTQQPAVASTSSSGLSQYMLLEPLSVHGVPQSAARKASSCASDEYSRSPRAAATASCNGYGTADCCPSAAANQSQSNSAHAAAEHLQRSAVEQLHFQQLMLHQDSPPQTAAEILAARAKNRRMRIQQRNLLGPAAFARGHLPRPGSRPPVVLDGEHFDMLVKATNINYLQIGSNRLAHCMSCCYPHMHVQTKMML
jgi:hypothetical protein